MTPKNNKQGGEKIVKAGIKWKGKVYTGYHHRDIIDVLWQTKKISIDDIKTDIQGFVTDTGRFVNRSEGADIAFKAGQIKSGIYSLDSYMLF